MAWKLSFICDKICSLENQAFRNTSLSKNKQISVTSLSGITLMCTPTTLTNSITRTFHSGNTTNTFSPFLSNSLRKQPPLPPLYPSGLKRTNTTGRKPTSWNSSILRRRSHWGVYDLCWFSSHSTITTWVNRSMNTSGRRLEHPPSIDLSNTMTVSGKALINARFMWISRVKRHRLMRMLRVTAHVTLVTKRLVSGVLQTVQAVRTRVPRTANDALGSTLVMFTDGGTTTILALVSVVDRVHRWRHHHNLCMWVVVDRVHRWRNHHNPCISQGPFLSTVFTDGGTTTILALDVVVDRVHKRPNRHNLYMWCRCRPCSQMDEPPQSLHWRRCRPCSQKPEPPQSLHVGRCRPCSQMDEPPQSLHWRRRRPCSQMPEPPQSLHWARCRPCSQMPEPPQSLHWARRRPCSQMPPPPHGLQ